MRQFKKIFIYMVISMVIFCFISFKTISMSNKVSYVSKSAIEYAQSVYSDIKFEMISWNYNRKDQTYTVTLSNIKNKSVLLYCIVNPNFQNGEYYDVVIFGGKNIDMNIARKHK